MEDARGLLIAAGVVLAGVGATLFLVPHGAKGAVAAAQSKRAAGDSAGALTVLLDCAAKDPKACDCADAAEELAVDLGRYDDAKHVVDASQCAATPRHEGGRAEVQVLTGDVPGGMQGADAVLATTPDEPHALFARAFGMSNGPEAIAVAEHAVKAGRGLPALIQRGSMRMRAGDMDKARQAFDTAAKDSPTDARAAFDAAVIAQQQGRYHDAREGYLKALSLDPKMADARYNLVILTHARNADDEARHHLAELKAIAPNDPRIPGLEAQLGGK
jgi:tetratricopeptide (TPR) repeat protein